MNILRNVQLVGWFGMIVMVVALVYGSIQGDLLLEGRTLLQLPWGVVSLIEAYLGIALLSCWIIWRERSKLTALGWVMLIVLLGNLVSCIYILRAAFLARGDTRRFWMGGSTHQTEIHRYPDQRHN
ncbi:MAG: DUF1475 domain-containing protein [Gammaproteobacteria bacterium]|nr:DUF1475 domain-containing protein [Gammaproteobacteria bacterium]